MLPWGTCDSKVPKEPFQRPKLLKKLVTQKFYLVKIICSFFGVDRDSS